MEKGARIKGKYRHFAAFVYAFVFTLLAISLISSASSSYNIKAKEMLAPPTSTTIKAPFPIPDECKFYRQALDERSRGIYDAIEKGVRTLDTVISLPDDIQGNDLEKVLEYVMNDNPDIFWTGIEYSVINQWGHPIALCPEYLWEEEEIRHKMDRYNEIADDIIARLPETSDPHVQMDEICRHIAARAVYEYDENRSADCQNLDSVFSDGVSVCAGYARAVQFVALKHGLKCSYVSGHAFFHEKLGAHAWNVLFDERGNASYYDATWGDADRYGYESFWSARPFEIFPLHEPDLTTIFPKIV